MIKTGLVSITFRQLKPEKIVALVAQAGLDAIEWGGDVHVPHGDMKRAREVRALTLNHGVAIASYGSYYRAGESEGENLSFESVLESARELGAPSIRVWGGKLSSAQADTTYRQRIADDLHRIASQAAAHGIVISCEFHDGTLCDTAESALDLLAQASHPNLRSYWQPRHGESTESGLRELDALAPILGNIHVFHWWPTLRDRNLLSEGAARWLPFLSRLQTIPGDRHLLIEFVQDDLPENFLRDAATLRSWV